MTAKRGAATCWASPSHLPLVVVEGTFFSYAVLSDSNLPAMASQAVAAVPKVVRSVVMTSW
ncbi:hypothetical protein ACIQF5_35540 [Streptomyces goshikiensis]|uniref:hypothetical protein n=1 Tax=Streptomyces goshikiensis TaxID=1942 RepID=UPI00382CFDCC